MSVVHPDTRLARPFSPGSEPATMLPLLAAMDPGRGVAWRAGRAVSAGAFLAHVAQVAATLPTAPAAVNLCEDRYAFLVAFCALVVRGQTNLLPPSRAPQMVAEVMATHAGCYALGEQALAAAPRGYHRLPVLADGRPAGEVPMIPADQLALIAYTSGSTGAPRPNAKCWGALHAASRGTRAMLARVAGAGFTVVATVPPQHIYGIEMSVLLPLFGPVAVHAGRPFFPADVAAALAAVPAPRVLVTTPVHLRALVASGVALPPLAAMLSATAPMPSELARAAERRFDAPVLEVFGSTETCAIASRRVTADAGWSLYPGVRLHPRPDGTEVDAPQLDGPVVLADLMEVDAAAHRFHLHGRQADLLEIAGKRASLGDLTHRLLAIPGVADGVVFQLDAADHAGVRRIAALAVAPALDEATILDALRRAIDPVFLPRRLRLVDALPRNETGKLPRAALLTLLG